MAFPSLPVAALRGRGGSWAAGRRQLRPRGLPGPGTGGQREVAQPCHKPMCLLLLQGLGGWCGAAAGILALARNWGLLGNVFEALQGNVPWAFLLIQNLTHVPYLPQPGAQGEPFGHSLQLRLTLQKYQEEMLQLKNVAAVSLLAGWSTRAKVQRWP